ncbi:MAG TPA: hypothetical protein VGH08_11350 [Chthoniobacterales bacterium]|jgi:hypothetical protein
MKTDENNQAVTVFLQNIPAAVSKLKNRLQRTYEKAYPGLGDIIRIVLDEEEAKAWSLSPFPHLFLPDLVEAHVEELGLQPAETRYDRELPISDFSPFEDNQLFPALCGS